MIVELHALSDVGRVRQGNEDNFLVLDLSSATGWTLDDGAGPPENLRRVELGKKGLVLVVSDGMGGALAGDVASQMAVDSVREMLLNEGEEEADGGDETHLGDCLRRATEYANYAIHRKSLEDAQYSGMGATFTGAAVTNNELALVQVGDSRAYLLRGNTIKLVTKDQSLVQQLVDVGQISQEEAETHMFRNVILQALGAQSELSPAMGRITLKRGDILLLCSDGLSGKLHAEDMRRIIADARGDLAAASQILIAEANRRGGEDNITVVLARFTGEDLPESDSEDITIELPPDDDTTLDGDEDDTGIP